MYQFLKYQMSEIIALKNEKHFYFALLLSIKFFMMSATIATYLYIQMMVDVSWASDIYETTTYFWVIAGIVLFILVGKQIIKVHMRIFSWIDEQGQKLINWYALHYYKKHKKDAPILDNMAKYSTKLFGWWFKLTPQRRKILLITIFLCYGTYFIGMQFVDELALAIDAAFPGLEDI